MDTRCVFCEVHTDYSTRYHFSRKEISSPCRPCPSFRF